MVFKPWTDLKQPRHILAEEDDEFAVDTPIPQISIKNETNLKKYKGTLLIIPSSLKSIDDAFKKSFVSTEIASILITKQYPKNFDSEDFIEEEQLYSTDKSQQEYESVISSELIISQYIPELSVLVVPHYEHDIINYSLISKTLLKSISDDAQILSITPGSLPFNELIGKLSENNNQLSTMKNLVPPFFVTGITGSLISTGEILHKSEIINSIVLQSEGVPGFEKINSDSFDELTHFLVDKFGLSKQFIKDADLLIHNGKSMNNFGLYL